MSNIRIAIIGYGNVGKYAAEAVQNAPDMELAGFVRRSGTVRGAKTATDIRELGPVDVALLCTPTRAVPEQAKKYLEMGIHTLDSYDIHTDIASLRAELGKAATEAGKVAVISAGWDPGSDSVVRALMQAMAPRGVTYTNFGPGMSMGHSVAAKAIEGVADALSVTIPLGTGVHRRLVYVQLAPGAAFGDVAARIRSDDYFCHDETIVTAVDDVAQVVDVGHGVNMTRKGVSGDTHNQMFEFNMRINNPALTSQVMVAAARAAVRQKPGAYTMIELPVVDLLPGDREYWVKKLV